MKYIKIPLLFVLLSLVFIACNKEELAYEKAMHIVINGYNGDTDELEVSIDTTVYDKNVKNGKFVLKPISVIGFNVVYTYKSNVAGQVLSIRNTTTGHVLYTATLPEEGTKATFNFIYLDGREIAVEYPPVDANMNKLGFYLNTPQDNSPIDIFLYRKDDNSGTEYREYLAKNVHPNTWAYADYVAVPDFDDRSKLDKSSICFTKAGTIDQWAIEGDENRSKVSAFGKGLPVAGEKGLVQPYFLTPSAGVLTHSSLFFYPDRTY